MLSVTVLSIARGWSQQMAVTRVRCVFVSGVPLGQLGLMWRHRKEMVKLMQEMKKVDAGNTIRKVKYVQKTEKQHRPSVVELADKIVWLAPTFQKFEANRWFAGPLFITMRLCQSSMMLLFNKQSHQAVRPTVPSPPPRVAHTRHRSESSQLQMGRVVHITGICVRLVANRDMRATKFQVPPEAIVSGAFKPNDFI